MTLAEQLGVSEPRYVEATPFARVGTIAIHFVRYPCHGVQDQIVGIGLRPDSMGDRGIFVADEELPFLADVINGLVSRGRLGQR